VQFESPPQRACYTKIFPWMDELFGESLQIHPDRPEFALTVGSALAQTLVLPFQSDAVIATRAYVVRGVPATLEFFRYLLEQNDRMTFGAFGIDPEGDVFLEHSIIGSTCDQPELEASILAVALLADHYDDEIANRWGGRRASD